MINGKFDGAAENRPWMLQLEKAGHRLIDILGMERSREINISYIELYKVGRSMILVSSILAGGTFKIITDGEEEFEPFEKLIGYYYSQIGDWSFSFLVEVKHGGQSVEGSPNYFNFSDAKIIRQWVFKQNLAQTKERIIKEFEGFKKSQSVPVAVVEGGDMVAWNEACLGGEPMTISID